MNDGLFEILDLGERLHPELDAVFLDSPDKSGQTMPPIDEVKQLLAFNLAEDAPIMKSLGVRELAAHIQGKITLPEAIAQAQQATRNYAKRQMTWFRHQLNH